jgi:MerR family transcriptional regulator/heat shock protein HspR
LSDRRFQRDPSRPCYVISVAASLVEVHPRTLRIYEDEGLLSPARTPTNIRLYSENDIRRILWIRRLTQERGVNLAGVRLLFELEERLGTRILEALFDDDHAREAGAAAARRGDREAVDQDAAPEGDAAEAREPQPSPSTDRPITKIVATRVASRTPSGDSND